jgi:hypothetical protein
MSVTQENDRFLEAVARLSNAETTSAGLLKHLQYFLKEIDRISDQLYFLLPGHGGARLNGFSWKMTLWFIGISLAVTPLNPNIVDSIWDNTEENVKAIRELLNLSQLFRDNPAKDYEVDAAMSSLEMIFMSLDTEAEAPAMERTQSSNGAFHISLPVTSKKRASKERLPNAKKSRSESEQTPDPEQKIKLDPDEQKNKSEVDATETT